MADNTVMITFGANIAQLVSGVNEIKTKLTELGETAKKAGELLGLELTRRAIVEFINSMSELGERTERSAAILGVTTEEVGLLSGVAKLTGTSFEGLQNSLGRMSLRMQESLRDGLNPTAQGLAALGISAKTLIGLPTDKYMEKLAESFGKLKPSLATTTAATAAFGRGIADQLPLLLQGAEAYRQYQEAVKATGTVLSEGQVKALAETNTQLGLLSLSVQGLGVVAFLGFKPAIDGVTNSLKDLVQWFRRSIDEGGSLSGAFHVLTTAAKIFSTALASIVSLFEALIEIGALMQEASFFGPTKEEAAGLQKRLEDIAANWKKTFQSIWSPTTPHGEGGGTETGAMDPAARDRLAAQIAAIQTQIKLADLAYQKTAEGLNAGVKLYELTESQKTAGLLAALDKRFAAEMAETDKAAALPGLTLAEYQKFLDEKLLRTKKFELDRQKIINEGRIVEVQSWTTDLKMIQTAWDSQLRGLLTGTTTWAQATKNIVADLVIAIIKKFEELVIIETLAKSMQKLFGAFDLSGLLKAIAANIALTYTEMVAWFTPSLGPFAPAAAAVVAGTVGAAAGAFIAAPIPGAETGAWNIPATSPWLLHRGETVLPSKAADTFRAMASGAGFGGGGLSVSITAMDGADAVRVLSRHMGALTRLMQSHMATNPSSHG